MMKLLPLLITGSIALTAAGAPAQARASSQLSPAESRRALDAAMKAAMAFELPTGLSREQIGAVGRVAAYIKRENKPEALRAWGEFLDSMKSLGSAASGNIMETLFYVLRESVLESNEDKKHYLSKLKRYNQLGRQLSDYLKELGAASKELEGKQGTREIGVLSIQGTGENMTVRRASRRTMNAGAVRAEADLARKAAGTIDFEISKAGQLLKDDLAKDLAALKKVLDYLRDFEAEIRKKIADKQGQRPPPV